MNERFNIFMEHNETKKETITWESIVAVILLVGVIITCSFYMFYLHSNWNKTIEELRTVTAEKELVEARLTETEEDLEIANSKIERQVKTIRELTDEIDILTATIEEYETLLADEDARWKRRYEEYDTATEVWVSMKALGWNDIVCAGIMGNLIAETGGPYSLKLDWDSNTSSGYGLVQWTDARRAAIKEKYGEFPTVKEQVQFIHDELYGANGVTMQVSDSELNAIMNAETPEDCAYAFACYYERCNEEYRDMRRDYARWAYNYFVVDQWRSE